MVKTMGDDHGDGCFRLDYVKLLAIDHCQSTKNGDFNIVQP